MLFPEIPCGLDDLFCLLRQIDDPLPFIALRTFTDLSGIPNQHSLDIQFPVRKDVFIFYGTDFRYPHARIELEQNCQRSQAVYLPSFHRKICPDQFLQGSDLLIQVDLCLIRRFPYFPEEFAQILSFKFSPLIFYGVQMTAWWPKNPEISLYKICTSNIYPSTYRRGYFFWRFNALFEKKQNFTLSPFFMGTENI